MDRLFDWRLATTPAAGKGETDQAAWNPAVDVTEDADQIVLVADLPGVREDALDLQVEKGVLTLKGQRKLAREGGELYRRYERKAGSFARSFRLPESVNAAEIAASLKDGVLTLTLPKRKEAQPRQIKVSVQ
jgi:HSP20 family protein